MKKAIRGTLLSGLVFPGLGQVVLGRRLLGAGIILATTLALVLLVMGLSQRVGVMSEQLLPLLEQGTVGLDKIIEVVLRNATSSGGGVESFATPLLLACWLGSSLHAFFLGWRLERQEL